MTRPQEIRKEVLLQLYAARPLAVSPELMARQAKKAGLDYTVLELRAECDFLRSGGMIEGATDGVSGERKWKITSAGILEYENN